MCRNCVKFPADNDVPTHVSFLTQLSQRQAFNFPIVGHKGLAACIYLWAASFKKNWKKVHLYSNSSYFLQFFLNLVIFLNIGQIKATIFIYVRKTWDLNSPGVFTSDVNSPLPVPHLYAGCIIVTQLSFVERNIWKAKSQHFLHCK